MRDGTSKGVAWIAALLIVPALAAQVPPPLPSAPAPTLHIGVTAVEIDTVVTDSSGRHVPDLRATDFELLQDGKPQSIATFRYVPGRSRAERRDSSNAAREAVSPASTTATDVPLPSGAQLRRNQAGRIMAVVIDDLSVAFQDMARVRIALGDFIDHEVRADDAVAIVTTSRGVGRLQQFTNDKAALKDTIAHLQVNLFGLADTPDQPDDADASMMSAEDIERQKEFAEHRKVATDLNEETLRSGALNSLQNVVRGMRELPGRKSVIFVSDGFALVTQSGKVKTIRPYLMEAFRRLVDESNRSFVVIHTLDARGLFNPLGGAFDADHRASPSTRPDFSAFKDGARESQDGPMLLAQQGGGLSFSGNNLDDAFAKAISDQEGYYILGYEPESATFRRAGNAPAEFHGIQVRVKRSGLRTRTRSGFFGVTDEEAHPTPRNAEEQLWTTASSPFLANDLAVRVTPLFSHAPGGDTFRVLVHLGGQGLAFTKGEDGQYGAPVEMLAALIDSRGAAVEAKMYKISLRSAAEPNAVRREAGFTASLDLPARQPGAYQLRLAVRDVTSNRTGNGYQFVRIPNLARPRLAISGVTLQAPNASPAVRRFAAMSTLAYAFETYNAQVDPAAQAPALTVRLRLYHNGSVVIDGKPTPIAARPKPDDPARIAEVTGDLPLTPAIKPGEYQLQIEVTDTRARKGAGTSQQWIDFTVTVAGAGAGAAAGTPR